MSGRKIRGAAARNYRDKESRDRQKEIAAQRAEAANKRNARSERRRGDGMGESTFRNSFRFQLTCSESPPPTPGISPSKGLSQPANTSQKATISDAPSSHRNNQGNQGNHRKTGRPPARRGRLGRNQYTRDLPLNGEIESPMRDHSHDAHGQSGSPPHGPPGGSNGINGESGRNSRPKYHNPTRTSMNEMKRRVAAILEFVSRMQTGKQSHQPSASGSEKDSKGGSTPNGVAVTNAMAAGSANSALLQAVEAGLYSHANGESEKNFADMASSEMMGTLTRELLRWQSLYGKHGER